MGQERSGIALLLGLLLLFSSFLGALYANVKQKTMEAPIIPQIGQQVAPTTKVVSKATQKETNSLGGLGTVSAGEMVSVMTPLILSESIEKIIAFMKDLPAITAHDILIDLLTNPHLKRDNFLRILFGVALHYDGELTAQNNIISILLGYLSLRQGAPIFYVAANSRQAKIIPALLIWIEKYKNDNPWLNTMQTDALQYAVRENNSKALKTLYKYGLTITAAQATQLLWQAVTEKRGLNVIKFLIKRKADINYAQHGVTILMQAVRSLRPVLVTLLVERPDIKINAIADVQVGSVLQEVIAMQEAKSKKDQKSLKKLIRIEEILRHHGANQDE